MAPIRAGYKHSHLLSVELQELLDVCKYNVLPASQVFWQFSDIVHCRHVMLCVCVCVCVCVGVGACSCMCVRCVGREEQ